MRPECKLRDKDGHDESQSNDDAVIATIVDVPVDAEHGKEECRDTHRTWLCRHAESTEDKADADGCP